MLIEIESGTSKLEIVSLYGFGMQGRETKFLNHPIN